MNHGSAALVDRRADDIIAVCEGRQIPVAEFLAAVSGLAALLPTAGAVVNLCESRYRFLVGFAAALSRGLTTLLPPNPLAATVAAVTADWSRHCLLVDGPGESSRHATGTAIAVSGAPNGPAANPAIANDLLAAVSFTSGSTGSSMPQAKRWGGLVATAALNRPHYLGQGEGPFSVVATVPSQHMYGVEGTILGALRTPIAVHDGRPFYPADVAAALAAMPAPRILFTTPVHLKALTGAGIHYPAVHRLLCATAPLDPALAASAEATFGAALTEVYGCSELGSMASRRAAADEPWTFFTGLRADDVGETTKLHAPHLGTTLALPDRLEFDAAGRFRIVGRDADLVKIGGKRSSLAEITRQLLRAPGVADAVVFHVPEVGEEGRLAALVVLTPGVYPDALRPALAAALAPGVIPRPILAVPALPRAATGKLPRDAVLALYRATVATA